MTTKYVCSKSWTDKKQTSDSSTELQLAVNSSERQEPQPITVGLGTGGALVLSAAMVSLVRGGGCLIGTLSKRRYRVINHSTSKTKNLPFSPWYDLIYETILEL